MSDKCTYPIYHETDDHIESKACDKSISFVMTNEEGREFPRCGKHCSAKVQKYALEHGYKVKPA